jgi:hypothetical protein
LLLLFPLELAFDQPKKVPLPQIFNSFLKKPCGFLSGTVLLVLFTSHEVPPHLPPESAGRFSMLSTTPIRKEASSGFTEFSFLRAGRFFESA